MRRQRATDKAGRAAWDHLAGAPGAWLDRASVMKEAADLIGERFVSDAAPVSQPTSPRVSRRLH